MPLVDNARHEIFGFNISCNGQREPHLWVFKLILIFVVTFAPYLLFLKWVLAIIARDLEVSSQHGHVDCDSGLFMSFLVSTIYFDWAKGKERIHQLSVLEQMLKSDDEFLKGICIFELDGSVNDGLGILMGMCVD